MNTVQVTTQQLAQFRDEGYTVFPTFFDADELAAMLAELERFKREGLGRNVATDDDGKTHSTRSFSSRVAPGLAPECISPASKPRADNANMAFR